MQPTTQQISAEILHVIKKLGNVLAESTRAIQQDSPHHLHQVQDQEQRQQQQETQSLPRVPRHTVRPQLEVWLQQQQQRSKDERQHLLPRVVSRVQEQLPSPPQHLLLGPLTAVLFQHELQNGAQLAFQQCGPYTDARFASGVSSNHTHAAHTKTIIATPAAAAHSDRTRLLSAAVLGVAAFVLRNTSTVAEDVRQVAAAPADSVQAAAPADDDRPMAAAPADDDRPMAAAPADDVRPMAAAPAEDVRPMAAAPAEDVRPMAAAPADRIDAAAPAACNGPASAAAVLQRDIGTVELSIHTPAPYFISQPQRVQGSSDPVSSSIAGLCRGRAAVNTIRANTVSLQQVQAGLNRFIAALRPTPELNIMFHAAFTIVKEACIAAEEQLESAGHPFGKVILAGVKMAGSCTKDTHLSKGSDLDVLVQLTCQPGKFDSCKKQFLEVLHSQLQKRLAPESSSSNTPADDSSTLSTGASLDQLLAAEWRFGASGCVPAYYVRYLVSGVQVDVQVAKCRGTVEEMRAHMRHRTEEAIAEARAGEAGTGNAELPATPSGAASNGESNFLAPSTCNETRTESPPRKSLCPRRQRVTDLAELQTHMLTDIEVHHGVQVATTVRDVIRVLKALVANCLLSCLEHASTTHVEVSPVVPGSVLELIVVWVFDLSTQQHARGCTANRPLTLLLAVLAAISEHLRPVEKGQNAPIIAVPRHYSWGDLLNPAIHQHWGCGRLFTPYIINSCDPVYNCTAFINFRNWDRFARSCHQLLQRFYTVMALPAGHDGDAWQELCRNTCLETAVATYDSV